jgi:hypothetical protein
MLENLTYYSLFGKPLIMYLGILVLISLISTAALGAMVLKGKVKFEYHKTLAVITICLALLHGALGILNYF